MNEKPEGGGYSLTQIRSMIAHGNLTLLEKEDERIVRDRVYEMSKIAKEFIMRLSCALKPSDDLPKWSGYRAFGMSVSDPRTCLVATREDIFPKDVDWRIKTEWCIV